MHVVVHCSVQSGSLRRIRSSTAAGMGIGCRSACGWQERNKGRLSRVNASASVFCIPLKWVARTLNSHMAERNDRRLIKFMAWGVFDVPELMIATTAALSHLARIVFPFHLGTHITAATTMGASSFIVMWSS